MKLKEGFVIQGMNPLLSDWGHGRRELKHKYVKEGCSEVKTYKLNKNELEKYLKNGSLPKRVVGK